MTPETKRSVSDRITLRAAIAPDDTEFLQELYFSTRDDLKGIFPDADQLHQILAIQHRGQELTYSQQFPNASHEIVLLDKEPVGRVLIDRRPDLISFIDFALLPNARNLGIGTAIFDRLLAECASRGVPCVLQVTKTNRAQNLYRRVGFRVVEDTGTHFFMKWNKSQDD